MTGGWSICGSSPSPTPKRAASRRCARTGRVTTCRPAIPRARSLTRAVVFGAPDAVLMDLPQLTEDQPAHRPFAAAHAVPWPGEMAVFRSPSTDGFELLTTLGSRARIGTLVSDFYAGPTARFDLGNALVVDLLTGTLESVTDLTLFGGANALAIESAPGVWEIVQAGTAELARAGPVSADTSPAWPARHGRRDGQPGACWRAGRGAGRQRWRPCQSPRPISASRGTGASALRAARSATRPMSRNPSRLRAWGCGRSRSPMSSSRGASRVRPAI
jgi:hypothetical protein